uniref:Uncharacterized mitochondrial protein AtMg00810-like n=1 Tax=Nicotiana tabacum TaxID=4097 RepID=A0A1S3ZZX4_TOBAC|nr:PREDICTED: uncharacterized mitochondrial protein AtMg00810-like [Nicotiana tabacum]
MALSAKGSVINRVDGDLIVILVYVDDLLVTRNNLERIYQVRTNLQAKLKMKDLGELKFFLGIEFSRSKEEILINQRKYVVELVSELGLACRNPVATPLEFNHKLTSVAFDKFMNKGEASTDAQLEDPSSYQRLVGRLLHLTMTKPDIAFVVQGSCVEEKKSITGYIVKFGGALISWKPKNQSTDSRSSAESEFRSMAANVAKVTWLVGLFGELGVTVNTPVQLFCDSKVTIQIAVHTPYS